MGLRSRDCGAQSRRVISFSSISFWPFWRCVWGHCPAEKCNPPQQSQIPLCWAVSDHPKSPHTASIHPPLNLSKFSHTIPAHTAPYHDVPTPKLHSSLYLALNQPIPCLLPHPLLPICR